MITTRELMQAVGVSNNQKRFVLRDEYGIQYDGPHSFLVLAALCRSDLTPTLSASTHRVAYAIHKSLATGRMPPIAALRIRGYKPSRICGLVARVHEECYDKTIGEIADIWLVQHAEEL